MINLKKKKKNYLNIKLSIIDIILIKVTPIYLNLIHIRIKEH